MDNLVGTFTNMGWDDSVTGVREKKIVICATVIRMLELTSDLIHPNWCVTGHTGYVLEGEFVLNIDGVEHILQKGDIFVVKKNLAGHRHIPSVDEGKKVRLLLLDDA